MLRRLWRDWVRPYSGRLLVCLALMAMVAATSSAYPLLIKWTFDLFEAKDVSVITLVPPVAVLVTAMRGLSLYLQTVQMTSLSLRVTTDMQKAMFAHLTGADLARLMREPVGTLISRFTHDLNSLRDALNRLVTNLLRDVLTVIGLVATMFYLDWALALAVLLIFPLAGAPIVRIGQRLRKLSTSSQEQVGAVTALLNESLSGARMVKAYGLEPYENERAGGAFERLRAMLMRIARNRALIDPLMEVLAGLALAGVIAFVGYRISTGASSIGDFVGFVAAVAAAAQPARAIGSLNAAVQEGLAAAARVFALIDEPPSIADAPDAKPLAVAGGRVTFERVGFAYAPGQAALNTVSFEARPGAMLALVGPSGAGKSTIINLIPRLFDASGGRILIDGQDIRAVTLASLRASLALVSQDVVLFDDTVRANIAFGRPDASDAEIEAAARAAHAHDFITALPQAYATRVGERGLTLSGGQRQRIAIARAMLKNAPILLLDEATSALDSESERQVQAALNRLMLGRTSIVIAHRLSTIMHADQIVVMDAGAVAETGTHGELLARGGLYARLYRTQFAEAAPLAVGAAP